MTYYLVLTETSPDLYQPSGGVVFGGFFHTEDDLNRAIETPGSGLMDGTHVVYVGKSKAEGKAPTEWTKRRKSLTIKTETRVS